MSIKMIITDYTGRKCSDIGRKRDAEVVRICREVEIKKNDETHL